jgi:hypothetical protein
METPYEAMRRRQNEMNEEIHRCYEMIKESCEIKADLDPWTIIPIPKGSNRCPLYHCPLSLTPVSSWHTEKEEK